MNLETLGIVAISMLILIIMMLFLSIPTLIRGGGKGSPSDPPL
jgi:hypothetical protein